MRSENNSRENLMKRLSGMGACARVASVVGGTFNLPSHRVDRYDEPYALPAVLSRAGLRFAIVTGDEAANERNLPYHAAYAAAYGLPKEEALKAITLYPVRILRLRHRLAPSRSAKPQRSF
jgi:imidazolonepropionase-like amidohydrolase